MLTFEELQALFDSRDLDIASMEQDVLDNASYFGRIFARSGGLTDAVREGIKEHGCENFDFKPVPCDGIEACRVALLQAFQEPAATAISWKAWPASAAASAARAA